MAPAKDIQCMPVALGMTLSRDMLALSWHNLVIIMSLAGNRLHVTSTVRFKRENPDLSLLDLKFRNMQGFGANMEISFMKYGSFMQKFAPFETFVKIT